MRKHFEKQLSTAKEMVQENLDIMKSNREQAYKQNNPDKELPTDNSLTPKSYFGSHYKVGDKLLAFLEIFPMGPEEDDVMRMGAFTEREFERVEKEYEFVSDKYGSPLLKRKKK